MSAIPDLTWRFRLVCVSSWHVRDRRLFLLFGRVDLVEAEEGEGSEGRRDRGSVELSRRREPWKFQVQQRDELNEEDHREV